MRKADIIGALLFLAASLLMAFFVIPAQTVQGTWHGLSPLAFPLMLMGGIALASAGLLIQALTQKRKYARIERPLTWVQLRNYAIVSVLIVLGALLMEHLGYWVGAPVTIAACMLYMGERHPLRLAATSLLPPLAVFLLTYHVLGTALP